MGIDIGSTTVKVVLLDDGGEAVFGEMRRHGAKCADTLCALLKEAEEKFGGIVASVKITGSGAINISKALGVGFVQEVVAVAKAIETYEPECDVAVELGGEDAKIIYFDGGIEERMNGVCAGGTGSFIDQMASLLNTDAAGLNREAENYDRIYPIAARCGVFAKTDIQPLINEGAARCDLAASIFQSVVNQTVSGLACGKPIRGKVAFLGGPLHFLPELKKAFIRTLKLENGDIIDPENSHLFAATGAALESGGECPVLISTLTEKLSLGVESEFEMPRLPALFKSEKEYSDFRQRHSFAKVEKGDISTYVGNAYLGFDAGSTTTKAVLMGEGGELLWSFYSSNEGDVIKCASRAVSDLASKINSETVIVRSCSTGYGEELLKSAFSLDEGEVETVAHVTAARFFMEDVDCVLDIGGQDMKCIKLKDGAVDSVLLNEACSSGCGSFIENFSTSLGYTAPEFASLALLAESPVDLGTRCTVFMNSNVKQAQKEGASVNDISAGLAYSVVKNALYKVIKLTSADELGKRIVVQGGTFRSDAVLRAFELVSGTEAVRPDISELMGALGAALIAKKRYKGEATSMLPLSEIENITYKTETVRCKGCENRCLLTVNTFATGKRISGNRCERPLGKSADRRRAPNVVEYKRERIFACESLSESEAPRGVIGIPRVLNIYENYPFWANFFKELGFAVVLSPFSSRKIYEAGIESIPSESECYPAKLAHGHVEWLISKGVKVIFHPCVFYEHKDAETTQNNYNCPMVISYAENLKNNIESIADGSVEYLRPFISFATEKACCDRLVKFCRKVWNIPAAEVRRAVGIAWCEQRKAKDDIREYGRKLLSEMEKEGACGIVLAGRPYHIDPEINHGIPELISSYGLYVFTEDSLPLDFVPTRPIRVLDQWVYHSRLYAAAEFVRGRCDLELLQLNSFGCGLDAVTSDQISEILGGAGKLYTLLKIDEIANLGACRIRIRSLIAAMKERREHECAAEALPVEYKRTHFTSEMKEAGYTIIAPQMTPIHFDMLAPVFAKYGYNLVVLDNDDRRAVDVGLKFVNNDACYPSVLIVGQIMEGVLSGRYDVDRLAVIMTQTGGCCRASNYIGFIRRALDKVGLSKIPVISLNTGSLEKNEGFTLSPSFIWDMVKGIIYGDLMMKCLYRVRPYEIERGSAEALHRKWLENALSELVDSKSKLTFSKVCEGIVHDFDVLPIDETAKKPRVGIVGEILVKYMPLANNHLVDLLEKEGAEAVVPDFLDFFLVGFYGSSYRAEYLGTSKKGALMGKAAIEAVKVVKRAANNALKKSKRFSPTAEIADVAHLTEPFLSIGNQYGEGWFLAGEMLELIESGVTDIVCIQPFGCLPNHVVGKGVLKSIRAAHPVANIAAVDYDPGASEVNQLNRIKLMLATAKKKIEN